MKNLLNWMWPGLLLMALSGCGTVEKMSRDQSLQAVLKSYEHTVRWGDVTSLPQYLQPELARRQRPVAIDPDNIRVINYEAISPPVMTSETQAEQTVKIGYLFKDEQRVLTLRDRQQWNYDEQAGAWQRSNPIPLFR